MQFLQRVYRAPNSLRLLCTIIGGLSLIGLLALAQSNPLMVMMPALATVFCLSIAAFGRPPQANAQKVGKI